MDWNAWVEELGKKLVDFAKAQASEYAAEARDDTEAFVALVKADLERWTKLLIDKKITGPEFEALLLANRDLAKMKALTAVGLAKARIQKIVDGMLKIVVEEAFKLAVV